MPTAPSAQPARYADPHRCPDCGHGLPDGTRTTCAGCGLPLQGQTAVDLFATLERADRLLAALRRQGATPAVAQPAPVAPRTPPAAQPAAPLAQEINQPSVWSVPAVLLALGALCLLVGAVVFLAVAWAVLGVGGRTAVLVGLTVVAAATTTLCARRGLRGGAEALAAVTGVFLALDLAGAFAAGWLGSPGPATATLVGSLAVAVASSMANGALRGTRTGRLVSPQVIAALALASAAAAALDRFAHALTTTAVVAVALLGGAALAARTARQPVLFGGAVVVTGLAWLSLLVDGAGNVAEHGDLGVTTLSWPAVAPLLVAAALVVALGSTPLPLAAVRQVALVTGCWLAGIAASLAQVTTPTGVVVLVTTGAVIGGVLSIASPRPVAARALAVASLGYAATAVLVVLLSVGGLGSSLVSAAGR